MKFRNQKFVWLVLSVIAFSFQINAQEKTFNESVLSDRGKQAYQTLLKVDFFAIGGIGYGGVTSNGEEALDILIKEKEAISALKNLIKTASPEGGLYALLGLKILDCDCFKDELKNYKNLSEPSARGNEFEKIDKGNVSRMEGCMGFQENRLKAASDIDEGKAYLIREKINNYKAEKQSEQRSN